MRLIFIMLSSSLLVACNSQVRKQLPANDQQISQGMNSFAQLDSTVFQPKCVQCHNSSVTKGGVNLAGYAAILSGGTQVVPGNPAQSRVFTEVQSGSMPDGGPPLSAGEVQALQDWILAGAPNGTFPRSTASIVPEPVAPVPGPVTAPTPKPPPTPKPTPGVGTTATYSQVQARIFNHSCVTCHSGPKAKSKVDLSSYNAVMKGARRDLIVPKDPAQSMVYTEIESGSMPPKGTAVSAADLKLLKDWILAGAKNN